MVGHINAMNRKRFGTANVKECLPIGESDGGLGLLLVSHIQILIVRDRQGHRNEVHAI